MLRPLVWDSQWTMDYNGYLIQVEVLRDSSLGTYRATYAILRNGDAKMSGVIAGNMQTREDAEQEALTAARRWIDAQSH